MPVSCSKTHEFPVPILVENWIGVSLKNRKRRSLSLSHSHGSFYFSTDPWSRIDFTAIDVLVIFARQTIRLFFIAIFSVITFGKRSPFLEFMSTPLCAERIWLCAFARVKRKYKTERAGRVWKFYSRRLYCTTSGTILSLYLRKRAPTCAAPFFTRKTPLRRNSARWITHPLS